MKQSAISPELVKSIPLFSGLTEQERDGLLKEGRIRSWRRGQLLFRCGDAVACFYLVTAGVVQLYRENPHGKQKTLDVLEPGQTLCADEIMDACRTHRANALAMEDTVAMEFTQAWLKDAARRHGAFALNLLSLIAQRARLAELEAEHQASMSAAQLVACFLQRLCVLHELDPRGFTLPYSKTLIASRLGMELETFSRALAKLKEQGITVAGTHVIIDDLTRIERYTCGSCSVSDACATHGALEKRTQDKQARA